MLDSIIRFLQEGGWFMDPIAVALCWVCPILIGLSTL